MQPARRLARSRTGPAREGKPSGHSLEARPARFALALRSTNGPPGQCSYPITNRRESNMSTNTILDLDTLKRAVQHGSAAGLGDYMTDDIEFTEIDQRT